MQTGEKIKAARRAAGLTQKELAERMDVTQVLISSYEKGKRVPKIDTLSRIASAIGCTLSDLAGDDARISQKEWSAFDALPGMNPAFSALAAADPEPLEPEDIECLEHFRPLTDENKEKAIDYMDYLKDRQ